MSATILPCWGRRWTSRGWRPAVIRTSRTLNNTTTKHFQSSVGVAAQSGWPLPCWAPAPCARMPATQRLRGALIEEALALCKVLGDVRMNVACETQLAVIEFAAGQTGEAIDRA